MNTQVRVFDVKHYAVHDGPGIRTTFFLMGCPLRCLWCQNPESWADEPVITYTAVKCIGCGRCAEACGKLDARGQLARADCLLCGECVAVCPSGAKKMGSSFFAPQDVLDTVMPEKVFFDASGGGVTFSGGECMLHAQFLAQTFQLLHSNAIHTVIDTCGAVAWEHFQAVLPYTDLFLYDIKKIDAALHKQYTGMDNALILKNLRNLCDAGARVIVRVPLIPNYTDSPSDIRAIGEFVRDALGNRVERCELLPYNKLAGSKYTNKTVWRDYASIAYPLPDMQPQSIETLQRLRGILEEMGVNVFCESL